MIFPPDKTRILIPTRVNGVGSWDTAEVVVICDLKRNLVAAKLPTIEGSVGKIASNADASRILTIVRYRTDGSSGYFKKAVLWDARYARLIWEIDNIDNVNSVAFSPDESLVVLTQRRDAIIYNAHDGLHITTIGNAHDNDVLSAVLSTDNKRFVTISYDTTPTIWETDSGRLITKLEGHETDATHAAISSSAELVATASSQTVRLWDLETGASVDVIEDGGNQAVDHISFDGVENSSIIGRAFSYVMIWDAPRYNDGLIEDSELLLTESLQHEVERDSIRYWNLDASLLQ